jgi:hypothetical protein
LYYPLYSTTGTYTVRYTDVNGCSSISSPVTVGPNSITNASVRSMKVYPNPTNGSFTVQNLSTASILKIYNVAGELVYSMDLLPSENHLVDTELSSGVYDAMITTNEKVEVMKIVISK